MVKEMKETEIGVIPSDWDILKLGDNCHIYRGIMTNAGNSLVRKTCGILV